jgi:hypothetical protein
VGSLEIAELFRHYHELVIEDLYAVLERTLPVAPLLDAQGSEARLDHLDQDGPRHGPLPLDRRDVVQSYTTS